MSNEDTVERTGSTQTFTDDQGNVYYGQDAVQAALRWGLAMQEHNRSVVEAMSPLERHRLERCLATGRWPTPPRRATNSRNHARECRPGVARRAGASSSTSSADPPAGEDDEPPPIVVLGEQTRLPLGTEPLRADCRLCGEPAVPGLLVCRDCWGYQVTLLVARHMLERAA